MIPRNLGYVAHVSHGSGDAEHLIVDLDSDNYDVVAIVDPGDIFRDLDRDPAELAGLFADAPKMLALIAYMLGAAEADCLDDKSNEWRSHMIAARALLENNPLTTTST